MSGVAQITFDSRQTAQALTTSQSTRKSPDTRPIMCMTSR